ncbi:MAG: DUF7000 family protein [Promethearchaeati archaeon]
MDSFHENMMEYKKQLDKGIIIEAYRGLMEYLRTLRTYFMNTYREYTISGNLYQGYMDMSYFAIFTPTLKSRKLKIAIVFLYEAFRFDVWLVGVNKTVQEEYWNLFKESNLNKYTIPSNIKGIDSIVEYILVKNPNFRDLDNLTKEIEQGTLKFIKDIEDFLSKL